MYKPELRDPKLIVEHLFSTYGPGADIPKAFQGFSTSASNKGGLLKNVRPDYLKLKSIELWGIEGAPFVTPVRQCLESLGLAHVFIPCAEGSKNRAFLERKTNKPFQVPYISDPNTGVAMFESAEIIKYLKATYTI